jgi:aminoglycoside 2'-N-acetyltransferase I
MDVRVFRSNDALPEHLHGQILALIRIEWAEEAGDYLGPEALPEKWHPCHVVGTEGDAIVSYVGVVWRDIEHAGQTFRTYGLSSMFTFPAARRRGLGSRIVERATEEIRRAGDADIALLFTSSGLERFYGRSGWQAMPKMEVLIGEWASPRVHDALSMMLFPSAEGERHRAAFENGRVYVGEEPW